MIRLFKYLLVFARIKIKSFIKGHFLFNLAMASAKITFGNIIKTSVVTAFTIAAALIWVDVISQAIRIFVPPSSQLMYKFIAAIIATIFVVIAIYTVQRTESEAELVFKKLKSRSGRW